MPTTRRPASGSRRMGTATMGGRLAEVGRCSIQRRAAHCDVGLRARRHECGLAAREREPLAAGGLDRRLSLRAEEDLGTSDTPLESRARELDAAQSELLRRRVVDGLDL